MEAGLTNISTLVMNYTTLSLAQTPPLSIPMRYFFSAPLFLILAGIVLLFSGPEALTSRWAPEILAITHLLVLGFIAMVMFGAMQQLLPVLIGVPVVCPSQVSSIVHLMWSLGILFLASGLLWGVPQLLIGGATTLVIAVFLFASAAYISLFKSTSQHATSLAMKLAMLGLLITVMLGLLLALGQAGTIPLLRHLTDIHMGWGLLAWIGFLLVGVAYQVVPMFQLTPNYPVKMIRYLVPILSVLLVLWSTQSWTEDEAGGVLEELMALVISAGYVLFAVITLNLQNRRRRRLPDTTLNFWRLAMVNLLLAVLAWFLAGFVNFPVPDLTVGVLFLVGFVVSAIIGMLFKIVPFLIWLHLNNRLQAASQWQGTVPNMKQIITERQARSQYRLFLVMLVMLLLATIQPGWFIHLAALLIIATASLLFWNLVSALRIYNKVLSEGEV